MKYVIFGIIGVLSYTSGLLVWPACLLAWRKHRTRASRWVFIVEAVCQLVLIGFFVFSQRILEHQYYWLVLMILVNLGSAPFAIGAALYDYGSQIPSQVA